MQVDTSREAEPLFGRAERLAREHDESAAFWRQDGDAGAAEFHEAHAECFRALAAENIALIARAEFLRKELDLQRNNLDATKRELIDLERHFANMLKERDAAIAERDRMRAMLIEAVEFKRTRTDGDDLVSWFAEWRECTHAALTSAKEPSA